VALLAEAIDFAVGRIQRGEQDIVGLYLNPPEHALVLSVDAFQRPAGLGPIQSLNLAFLPCPASLRPPTTRCERAPPLAPEGSGSGLGIPTPSAAPGST